MIMRIDIVNIIHKLPLNIVQRLQLERKYIVAVKKVKRLLKQTVTNDSSFYPLVRNNRNFGDEFLLRRYANINEDLFAIIEHGIYFGNNTQKTGVAEEWDLGCILTNGEYRKKLISNVYPDYYCEMIGPMIGYAQIDKSYEQSIMKKLKPGKTLLYFPTHGGDGLSPIYDREYAFNMVLANAKRWNCANIIICAFYTDYHNYQIFLSNKKTEYQIVIETCGNRYGDHFLDFQRTLINLSDYTISNSLGTHLGYCIYMQKPHVLLSQSLSYDGDKNVLESLFGRNNVSDNFKSDLEMEKRLFEQKFSENVDSITDEQYLFCDYYWGFSKIKTPLEIRRIYQECNSHALKYIKRNGINKNV